MTETFQIALLAAALLVCLAAYFAVLAAFFPHRVAKTERICAEAPGRALLAGFVNLVFLGVLFLVFYTAAGRASAELQQLVAGLFLFLVGVGLSFGLAGLVELAGARLVPTRARAGRSAVGAITLSLACALPFVGWFGLLPYAALTGLGGFILSFFDRRALETGQAEQ
jgi:hypothetical protein